MIYLLWATIRPEMMMKTCDEWMEKAVDKNNIRLHIAVNDINQCQDLLNYQYTDFNNLVYTDQKHIGVIFPINVLAMFLKDKDLDDDDIIVAPSDDFYPPDQWDQILTEKLKGKSGRYFVNDGYQDPNNIHMGASITIPIMTYDCLKKLNNMFYSFDYYHYYGDTELYSNVKDLGLLIDERLENPDLIFEHKNCIQGKRESDEIDGKYGQSMYVDRDTFNRRMELPVDERIKETKGVWE